MEQSSEAQLIVSKCRAHHVARDPEGCRDQQRDCCGVRRHVDVQHCAACKLESRWALSYREILDEKVNSKLREDTS